MSNENARKVAALTGGRLLTPSAVNGSGCVVMAVARAATVKRNGAIRITLDKATFTLHTGSAVSPGDSAVIAAYCNRHGLETPNILDFVRADVESRKGKAPATAWTRATDDGGNAVAPAFRLEYEAEGCSVGESHGGSCYTVKAGGVEIARFARFAVAESYTGAWGKVTGSPLESAVSDSKADKDARRKAGALDKLQARRDALTKEILGMRADGLTLDDLAGAFPAEALAAVYGPQA